MLASISEKIDAGIPLTVEDGIFLFREETPLHRVGELANRVRRRWNGNIGWYNINTHLNPTNICTVRCPLCAYHVPPDSPRAFTLGESDIAARAREAEEAGCTEIHVVGGIPPDKPYSWFRAVLEIVRREAPKLYIKAWTAQEIAYFAGLTGLSIAEVLLDMQKAGLDSLPGGGAEIFAPRVRKIIAPEKIDAETWCDVHRTAHHLGIPSNATMLFGHRETLTERAEHLRRLRDLQNEAVQAESGRSPIGFDAFVPLVFQSHERLSVPSLAPTEMLRTVAVSRLMLDNIPHIKAYWVTFDLGPAQIALGYGADDLDGTVRGERVHHDAGSRSPTELTVTELRRLIAETGHEPRERDSRYNAIKEK